MHKLSFMCQCSLLRFWCSETEYFPNEMKELSIFEPIFLICWFFFSLFSPAGIIWFGDSTVHGTFGYFSQIRMVVSKDFVIGWATKTWIKAWYNLSYVCTSAVRLPSIFVITNGFVGSQLKHSGVGLRWENFNMNLILSSFWHSKIEWHISSKMMNIFRPKKRVRENGWKGYFWNILVATFQCQTKKNIESCKYFLHSNFFSTSVWIL